ncbi:hypothetical protein AKJ59_00465 [candidate division MSBL1 archaeon SCGC-AAA385M02]|uniref:Uncharacterized protein n=1 Tax=candidate division MSBL1 archaeon SCGC-AAA385M02 TaxID=1698287 RepID=A0A133VQT9_9EURY|nr:hypothetical protein AKJ59_00465 [candidate division MSBL1 archaeon SCGC-AAA385M02]
MNLFQRLKAWLDGEYICINCGKKWYSFSCGTGQMICPECYDGEQPWQRDMNPWTGNYNSSPLKVEGKK